ncbi:polysaccharide biosynthesis protein [Aurantimonas sp. C2-5-R2]
MAGAAMTFAVAARYGSLEAAPDPKRLALWSGDLEEVVARLSRGGVQIDAFIVAAPEGQKLSLQEFAQTAARLRLPLRRVAPGPLTSGAPSLEDITLEDLLGHPPVALDLQGIRGLATDRRVLVTGAGGGIGSEIVRQVSSFGPRSLALVDNSEYALYEIGQRVATEAPHLSRRAIIADVRDRERIARVVHEEEPAIVFHAAALKYVPLVEANACEGVLTNVVGTRNVADAAVANGADAVVMNLTDKAIKPSSVMGATKRVAETYCQALDFSGMHTCFITVRVGNVLDSNGSVVPLFKRQIGAGGPVTVTHRETKRFFMTIREATELVLQAAANGAARQDQRGRIFVLDMGEPVRIVDLAHTMIALAGLRPEENVRTVVTGLRTGEKLFEELFDKDERTKPSGADGVFVAMARFADLQVLRCAISEMDERALHGRSEAIRAALAEFVPSCRARARWKRLERQGTGRLPCGRSSQYGLAGLGAHPLPDRRVS